MPIMGLEKEKYFKASVILNITLIEIWVSYYETQHLLAYDT